MKFEQVYLNTALIAGYFTGCSPTTFPLGFGRKKCNKSYLKYNRLSFISIYSIILALVILAIGSTSWIQQQRIHSNVSRSVTNFILFIEAYGFDFTFRVITIKGACAKVLEIIRRCQELEVLNYKYSKACILRKVLLISVGASLLFVGRLTFSNLHHLTNDDKEDISTGSILSGILRHYLLINVKGPLYQLVRISVFLLIEYSMMMAIVFKISVTPILGQMVTARYVEFCTEFEELCFGPLRGPKPNRFHEQQGLAGIFMVKQKSKDEDDLMLAREKFLQEFHPNLVKLRALFDLFAEVGGSYALLLMLHYTTWFVYCMNALFITNFSGTGINNITAYEAVFYCGGICQSIVTLFLVAHTGNEMRAEVNRCKLRLHDTFYSQELTSFSDHTREEKTAFALLMAWDWKFKAKNMIIVDHGLITGLAGTVMTYTIFMLQLKMTESQM